MLHPTQPPKKSTSETLLAKEQGVFGSAVSDLHAAGADQIAAVGAGRLMTLAQTALAAATRGPPAPLLRKWDAESTVIATLFTLAEQGLVERKVVARQSRIWVWDPEKAHHRLFELKGHISTFMTGTNRALNAVRTAKTKTAFKKKAV